MHHYADGIVVIRSPKIQAAHTRHRGPQLKISKYIIVSHKKKHIYASNSV